jgi:hypothetical protein
VECCVESAVNQYKYLSGKDDVNCVNCALIKVKLKTRNEIDILQEEMNWLKKNGGRMSQQVTWRIRKKQIPVIQNFSV